MKKILFLIIAVTFYAAQAYSGTTIPFPGSGTYATIKAAMDAAQSGDIIDIAAGTYTERITFNSAKDITLQGAGMGLTIIQATTNPAASLISNGSVFIMNPTSGTTNYSLTFKNMTIQHGNNSTAGGGVRLIQGASGAIVTLNLEGVKLSNNRSGGSGGGLVVSGAGKAVVNIQNCYITSNTAATTGGGIMETLSSGTANQINLTIKNSTISNNTTTNGEGAGIGCVTAANSINSNVLIENSTIYGNNSVASAKNGAGIYISVPGTTSPSNLTLNHCTIANNTTNAGTGGDGVFVNTTNTVSTNLVMNNCIVMNNSGSTTNVSDINGKLINGGVTNSIFTVASGNTWFPASGTNTNNTLNAVVGNLDFAGSLSDNITPVLRIGTTSIAKDYVIAPNLAPSLVTDQIGSSRIGNPDAGAVEYRIPQTITDFASIPAKTYGDVAFEVAATGGASGNPVTFSSSNTSIATVSGTTVNIVGAGACTINANQAGDATTYYSAPQVSQVLTVNAKALTVTSPAATSKPYDGSNAAVITGSLSGVINSDDVSLNGRGTFASTGVGTGIAVTSTSTLGGTKVGNYTLTQPTGLTADITAISTPVNTDSDLGNAATLPGTDVSVAAGNVLTVNNSTTVRSITVAPGAKLTVNDGVSLTATNGITLQNTAGGTASFVDSRVADNPIAIAGTVEQAITETNRNWYVAVPISGKLASDITLSGAKIVQRNEALSRWDDLLSGTTLTPGVGYIAVASASSGTTNWSLNGNLNSGKVEVGVTRSGASSIGFNLLGNPYPSYLNWEQVLNLNATNASLLQSSIWYRTKSGASYAFQTYNSAGRVATPTSTSGYIPPMQAFWVRANSAGTVTFTNAMRSHGDGTSNKLKAPKVNTQKIIRLQVSNAVVTDEAVVYIDQNAQNAFDKYDTEKMFNNVASQPELYTKAGTEKLIINGLSEISDNQEIPLGLNYTQGGDLKLKLTELNNFGSNSKVYLRDKQLSTETELSPETEYTFNTAAITNNESRFSLVYKVAGVSTGTTILSNNCVSVFVNVANQITIVAPEKSNYAIYNAVGQKVKEGITKANRTIANVINDSGVYVVQVCENGRINSTRVVLNGK